MHLQLLLLGACTALATSIQLPEPSGPYHVAVHIQPFNDTSRADPLDPSGKSVSRRLLASIFLPVEEQHLCKAETVPYMTPAVAKAYGTRYAEVGFPDTLFGLFEMQLCSIPRAQPGCKPSPGKRHEFPLLFLEPGFGESRLLYSAMARSFASHGFAVVTVDHPFDAVVEFPDGTVIPAANISDSDTKALEKVVKVNHAPEV